MLSKFPQLFHATRENNIPSIMQHGLKASFYGAVHGGMDIHPPKPSIYLSSKPKSDNLHASLFEAGPVVVLTIDTSLLDVQEFWPDDFAYQQWEEGLILASARHVTNALGVPHGEAVKIFAKLEEADSVELPLLLKPFWGWYLASKKGGEVAYSGDIPTNLIIGVEPYGDVVTEAVGMRMPG